METVEVGPLLVSTEDPLRTVIEVIDRAELQIALVIDAEKRLLGTVTDGDVRRALLRGHTLVDAIAPVMNTHPLTTTPETHSAAVDALMLRTGLRRIPVVGAGGKLMALAIPSQDVRQPKLPQRVVIMAGGLGSRLGTLTQDRPKPLLHVGAKPILETILDAFVEQGFTEFTFTVNYRAEMIMEYFGNGSRWGASIDYVRETEPLGTAGSLTLLRERPTSPLLVMNGDLLTKVDFRRLLEFHRIGGHLATMTVREHATPIPYGVVDIQAQRIVSLVEKPVKQYFINAGIYVLEPACIDFIPADSPYDITDLFTRLLEQGYPLGAFPIHEYWQDIGQVGDLQQAKDDYARLWAVAGPEPEYSQRD